MSGLYNIKVKNYDNKKAHVYCYLNPIFRTAPNEKQWLNRGQSENPSNHYKSIARTKEKIIDYSLSNQWEYFATFTFDPKNDTIDTYNYEIVSKKMSTWLENIRKRKANNLKYILVPEQHKSGRYHFHALMSNIGSLKIEYIKQKHNGTKIYNIKDFTQGFTYLDHITDNERVSTYISKYVTKALVTATFNKKRYWVSRNLNEPQVKKIYVDDVNDFASYLSNNTSYITAHIKEYNDQLVQYTQITHHQINGGYESSKNLKGVTTQWEVELHKLLTS